MNLNKLFLNYCKKNNLEINPNQLDLIEELNLFYNQNFNKSLLKKIFTKQNYKKNSISWFYPHQHHPVNKILF